VKHAGTVAGRRRSVNVPELIHPRAGRQARFQSPRPASRASRWSLRKSSW
jgi:hypothetical protein